MLSNPICKVPECTRQSIAKGFCHRCYERDRWRRIAAGEHVPTPRGSRKCRVMGCDRKHYGLGFCRPCYHKNRKAEDTAIRLKSQRKNKETRNARRRQLYATDEVYRERRKEQAANALQKRKIKEAKQKWEKDKNNSPLARG